MTRAGGADNQYKESLWLLYTRDGGGMGGGLQGIDTIETRGETQTHTKTKATKPNSIYTLTR